MKKIITIFFEFIWYSIQQIFKITSFVTGCITIIIFSSIFITILFAYLIHTGRIYPF